MSTSSSLPSAVPAPTSIARELQRFFEICIHAILYERGVYPAALFEPKASYGLAVSMSRHPELNQYIANLSSSVQNWLVSGENQRVVLVVLDPARSETNDAPTPKCIERFVFELCLNPAPSTAAASSAAAPAAASSSAAAAASSSSASAASASLSPAELKQLHEGFASILSRLSSSSSHFTAKRPSELSWTMLLYTNQTSQPASADKNQASGSKEQFDASAHRWDVIPLCAHDANGGAKQAAFLDFPIHQNRIMILKTLRLNRLHMNAYCEATRD